MRFWEIHSCNYLLIVLSSFVILSISSCDETYSPKPRGYFRIELPEKKYGNYNSNDCPFSFELPSYAVVNNYQDSINQPCWKYIRFPRFNGEIFFSYKPVTGNLSEYMEDSRALAYKHTVKANAIDETIVETQNNVYGMIYDIGGNAASSVQFYATDSTKHFIRGALYFNSAPQPDSLAPVIRYLRQDIVRLLTTLRWK